MLLEVQKLQENKYIKAVRKHPTKFVMKTKAQTDKEILEEDNRNDNK